MRKPSRKSSPRPEAAGAVRLTVRVQPRASQNGIARQPDGTLKVRLTAPPVDGAANDALVRFLAEVFAVSRSQIEIVSGQTGRNKVVRVNGIGEEDVQRLLNADGQ